MKELYRDADKSLAPLRLKRTIERSPFFVLHGGHFCREELVGRTTFWIFFERLSRVWSLYLVFFLVGLRTYQHPGMLSQFSSNALIKRTINSSLIYTLTGSIRLLKLLSEICKINVIFYT